MLGMGDESVNGFYESCKLCPRECGVNRKKVKGFCGASEKAMISRVSRHRYEEPVLCGEGGSGTVFFSGCSLRCVFCQNKDISRGETGREFSPEKLADAMLALQQAGAHNVNLVTPTHYIEAVTASLELAKPRLSIPVVYNCGGSPCAYP